MKGFFKAIMRWSTPIKITASIMIMAIVSTTVVIITVLLPEDNIETPSDISQPTGIVSNTNQNLGQTQSSESVTSSNVSSAASSETSSESTDSQTSSDTASDSTSSVISSEGPTLNEISSEDADSSEITSSGATSSEGTTSFEPSIPTGMAAELENVSIKYGYALNCGNLKTFASTSQLSASDVVWFMYFYLRDSYNYASNKSVAVPIDDITLWATRIFGKTFDFTTVAGPYCTFDSEKSAIIFSDVTVVTSGDFIYRGYELTSKGYSLKLNREEWSNVKPDGIENEDWYLESDENGGYFAVKEKLILTVKNVDGYYRIISFVR